MLNVYDIQGTPFNLLLDTDFEFGQNENGYYFKFPNGMLVCCQYLTITDLAFTKEYGALFYNNQTYTWTYPVTFVGKPSISINTFLRGGMGGAAINGKIYTGQVSFFVYSLINYTFADGGVSMLAIGRWK